MLYNEDFKFFIKAYVLVYKKYFQWFFLMSEIKRMKNNLIEIVHVNN